MESLGFSRIANLGGLPSLLTSLAGDEGLRRVFRNVGFSVRLLEAPDTVIPTPSLVSLYRGAEEITGHRSFGLEASKDVEIADLGLIGRYVLQSSNILTALNKLQAALPYHESGNVVEIAVEKDELRVGYRNICQNLSGWRHVEDFYLCAIFSVVDSYLGGDWQPLRVEYCSESGQWVRDREQYFQAPVHGSKEMTSLVLSREMGDSKRQHNKTINGRTVKLSDLRDFQSAIPQNVLAAVTNIVEKRLHWQSIELESVAEALGIAPHALRQHLVEHAVDYDDLVLACRMRGARELLSETDIEVRQIAQRVGYPSMAQFSRVFKEFMDLAPSSFRTSMSGKKSHFAKHPSH